MKEDLYTLANDLLSGIFLHGTACEGVLYMFLEIAISADHIVLNPGRGICTKVSRDSDHIRKDPAPDRNPARILLHLLCSGRIRILLRSAALPVLLTVKNRRSNSQQQENRTD